MKSLVILAIVLVGIVVGGCCTEDTSALPKATTTVVGHYGAIDIEKMEFDGHTYLLIARGHGISFCHHPDCSCEDVKAEVDVDLNETPQ